MGREIPDSITKYDLTEIIAVLCRKLDWVNEEPDPVEVKSRDISGKCDISKKPDQGGTMAVVPKTEKSLSASDKLPVLEKNSSLEAADGSENQNNKDLDPLEGNPKLAAIIDDSMDQSKIVQKDGVELFPCAYCPPLY